MRGINHESRSTPPSQTYAVVTQRQSNCSISRDCLEQQREDGDLAADECVISLLCSRIERNKDCSPEIGTVDAVSLDNAEDEHGTAEEPDIESELPSDVEEEVGRGRPRGFFDVFFVLLGLLDSDRLIFVAVRRSYRDCDRIRRDIHHHDEQELKSGCD